MDLVDLVDDAHVVAECVGLHAVAPPHLVDDVHVVTECVSLHAAAPPHWAERLQATQLRVQHLPGAVKQFVDRLKYLVQSQAEGDAFFSFKISKFCTYAFSSRYE